MGRTVLPYSVQLELFEKRLASFRRGLRRADQAVFDEILSSGKKQIQSGVLSSSPAPFEPLFLSALLELRKEIQAQGYEIERISERVFELKKDIGEMGSRRDGVNNIGGGTGRVVVKDDSPL